MSPSFRPKFLLASLGGETDTPRGLKMGIKIFRRRRNEAHRNGGRRGKVSWHSCGGFLRYCLRVSIYAGTQGGSTTRRREKRKNKIDNQGGEAKREGRSGTEPPHPRAERHLEKELTIATIMEELQRRTGGRLARNDRGKETGRRCTIFSSDKPYYSNKVNLGGPLLGRKKGSTEHGGEKGGNGVVLSSLRLLAKLTRSNHMHEIGHLEKGHIEG